MPQDAEQRARLRAVGSAVREARHRRGWSQEQLAEATGLHRTYVGSLERGERNVGVLNLYLLADALAVKPGELLPPSGK